MCAARRGAPLPVAADSHPLPQEPDSGRIDMAASESEPGESPDRGIDDAPEWLDQVGAWDTLLSPCLFVQEIQLQCLVDTLAYGKAIERALWPADITGRGLALLHNLRSALRQSDRSLSDEDVQALFIRGLGGEDVAILRSSKSQLVPITQFARSMRLAGLVRRPRAFPIDGSAVIVGEQSCVSRAYILPPAKRPLIITDSSTRRRPPSESEDEGEGIDTKGDASGSDSAGGALASPDCSKAVLARFRVAAIEAVRSLDFVDRYGRIKAEEEGEEGGEAP